MNGRPAWMEPKGRPWTRADEVTVFDNPWLALRTYRAVAPTGHPAIYAMVDHKNLAIAILPLFDDGTTVLVGQHRFPLQDYSWEIPEGGGAMDGDPADAARRELREEAGLLCADLRQVMEFQLSNSVTNERGFGYIATGLTPTDVEPDETEELAIHRIGFREALDLALKGGMKDMLTVAMLLRAYHMAREGELSPALATAMLEGKA